ncbi:zinc finger BED domain-containing protein 5-like [Hydra vulgaris]|uniref:zinc finger BED domain-containing protein 5-like n=1 Tax=Hydra vulgaris TaxID=6087 RepID=UPI001F5F9AE1|nr:zinc finger BED domain-containing protein 5-like [Hydra vulgaris]
MTNTFISYLFTLKYAGYRKACLRRFFGLFETILEFLDTKDKILKDNFIKWKTDIAYLTGLFTKFNMVNLQLQGDNLNLVKTKSILTARVKLMNQNIGRGDLSQFPSLSQINCPEDESTYFQHLNALYSDFETRFEDVLIMVIPSWIINPYGWIEETNAIIKKELIALSTNEERKVQFKNGFQQFWMQNIIPFTYPVLWNIARKFLISFLSLYLVERGFSVVTDLLTKKRNRLDIISRGDLRLNLMKLAPNVDNSLLKDQVHRSHKKNLLIA